MQKRLRAFYKEKINGASEAAKLGVILGIKALLFDEFPKALDQIQIGRIGRQKKQLDLEFLSKLLDEPRSLITRIIQNQRDRHLEIKAGNFPEKIADALGRDIRVIGNHDQFMGEGIQSARHIKPLPAGRRL